MQSTVKPNIPLTRVKYLFVSNDVEVKETAFEVPSSTHTSIITINQPESTTSLGPGTLVRP